MLEEIYSCSIRKCSFGVSKVFTTSGAPGKHIGNTWFHSLSKKILDQIVIMDNSFLKILYCSTNQDEMDLKTEAEATGTAHGALATNAPVGPLPVGGGASQLSSAHHNGGVAGGVARHGDHDPDAIGEGGGRRRRRGGGAAAGVAGASGEVIGVEEHVEQHHDDDDEPCLGSFGMLGVPTAPIGDFSPQFKFSFSDDIHLDLGSGLKVNN